MTVIKKILAFLLVLGTILLLATRWHFFNSSSFQNILTFLSVSTGFTITALSLIATSQFSKNLYQLESNTDNSKTLLHELVDKFLFFTKTNISTILLILIYFFTEPVEDIHINIYHINASFKSLLSGLIWFLTFWSFWAFLQLLILFGKFIIQEAKENNN